MPAIEKTIKEMAVDLTVKLTAILENSKGKTVFINQTGSRVKTLKSPISPDFRFYKTKAENGVKTNARQGGG